MNNASNSPIDPRAVARRNAVVYRCLTPDPAQSLCFGNGPVGGSLHTPDDSLLILISRADLWNENAAMGAIAAVRVRGRAGLFTKAVRVEQVCDLHDACIRVYLHPDLGPDAAPASRQFVCFELTCVRGQDLLVLDVTDMTPNPGEIDVTIENWHAGDATGAIDVPGWAGVETLHVNRASAFAQANVDAKVDAAAAGLSDPLLGRAWGLCVATKDPHATTADGRTLRLPPAAERRVLIAAVARPPRADREIERAVADVRDAGRALAMKAASTAGAMLAEHRRWWGAFWERSALDLRSGSGDAEYEERLWYVNHYLLACSMGGAYPPRFNGGTFLMDKDTRGWDHGYWFQNMRELYWPLPAAGHAQPMLDFFKFHFDMLPFIRLQSKALFEIDAPSFRETYHFWGPGDAKRANFCNNLELCLLMEWYVLATGDEAFLRDKLYPLLAEIMGFFLAYATKGEDGRWHLAPADAIEVWPNVKDTMPDLAGLHYLLPKLVEWGGRFGADAATLERWKSFHAELAPIPIGRWTITREFWQGIHANEFHVETRHDPDGLFLPAADKIEPKAKRQNMENAELYVVYPWGLVDLDSPPAELRRAENTWTHRTWRLVNNGWAQDVPQLARLGMAEEARTTSIEHALYNQRFPSGAFISPAGAHFHGLLTAHPYLDSAGVHLTGLQEMLLQSHGGVLRIVPSTSAQWSGRFKLHALGGLVVVASFTHGRPAAAQIEATRTTTLRLRNHDAATMLVECGGKTSAIPRGDMFVQAMEAGQVAGVRWEGAKAPPEPSEPPKETGPRPNVMYPAYKLAPPHACHPTGHWHDERKGHGQVGLAEDGLFPATRKR
ncbi:MAG: hypothetical protein NTW19_23815 [Planctomycetota bacterium]|nr:hypothetical protein [Planctomycetota bacterium]